jgi:hypothetical protein
MGEKNECVPRSEGKPKIWKRLFLCGLILTAVGFGATFLKIGALIGPGGGVYEDGSLWAYTLCVIVLEVIGICLGFAMLLVGAVGWTVSSLWWLYKRL